MYCGRCGAPGQADTFCGECGTTLRPGLAPQAGTAAPLTPATAPPKAPPWKWIGAVGAVVLLLAVTGTLGGGSAKHEITGSLTLTDADVAVGSDGSCYGTGGYSDIEEGAAVVVKNEADTVIATSELGPGTSDSGLYDCELPFTVSEVPDAKFYSVEVSHRGGLRYSKADMESQDWEVSATLG